MKETNINILVISWKYFKEGFNELFGANNSFECVERDSVWKKMPLYSRLRYANKFDVLHYFPGKIHLLEVILMKILGIKIILHFIGTDVMKLLGSKRKRFRLKLFQLLGCRIVAVHKRLIDELKSVGINAALVPFVNRVLKDNEAPLPDKFSVIAYVPKKRETHFRMELIEKAALAFPDVQFTVFPNDYQNKDVPNIVSIPYIPHDRVIKEICRHSAFLRLTVHDGLPNTVLEALSCARPVIWSFDHEYCYTVTNEEQLFSSIKQIKNQKQLNTEGKHFVLTAYSSENLSKLFHTLWGSEVVDRL